MINRLIIKLVTVVCISLMLINISFAQGESSNTLHSGDTVNKYKNVIGIDLLSNSIPYIDDGMGYGFYYERILSKGNSISLTHKGVSYKKRFNLNVMQHSFIEFRKRIGEIDRSGFFWGLTVANRTTVTSFEDEPKKTHLKFGVGGTIGYQCLLGKRFVFSSALPIAVSPLQGKKPFERTIVYSASSNFIFLLNLGLGYSF